MPYNSSQISGLVGGQMAMFSNQAAYAHQIGGTVGTGPVPAGGGIQNPFPNAGAKIAGGIGQGISGMATLGSVASIAMSGGLGMAAMAPIAAMGAVGENITAGAQSFSQVGGMANQYFGSQSMNSGKGMGGGVGTETIKNVVGVLQEMVGDDMRTTMEDLKKVMDQAGQMGMLGGINNASEFKNRFTKITRQIRDIADVMGTSMSEAAPMFSQMRKMGVWSSQDVMGTAMAARVAGPAAGQMMQSMGQAAQMSHAMGGTMQAGAMMGRESFMNLRAARQSGVLSQEDVMEFTGGLSGAAGQQAIAQRMTGIMGTFSRSGAGRAMMAGLGQTEDGKFTGQVDKSKLQQFLQGNISVSKLENMGYQSTSSEEGGMSFQRQEDKLGQQLGSQGGIEAITQIVQQVADTKFKGSEGARHTLFRQMLGVSNREAEMLGKMADELPRIQDQRTREVEMHTKRIFNELERKQHRSWEGFSNAAGAMMGQATRPFQELGTSMAASIDDTSDRLTRMLGGRAEAIPMGQQERSRLLRGGALTADMGGFNLDQFDVEGGSLSNVIRRMGAPGSFGKSFAMSQKVGAAGAGLGGLGVVAQMAGFAAPLLGVGEDMSPQQQALQTIGITGDMTRTEARTALRRAHMRAMSPTMSGLGLKDEGKLGKVRASLDSVIGQHSKELSRLKKEDPRAYTDTIIEKLKEKDPELKKMSSTEIRDYLAVASQEFSKGDLAIDFRADALKASNIASSPAELAEQQADLVVSLASETESTAGRVAKIGAASYVGIMAAPLTLGLSAVLPIFAMGPSGESLDSVKAALDGPGSDIFMEYMKDNISKEDAKTMLSKIEGGEKARGIIENLQGTSLADMKKKVSAYDRSRAAQIQPEALERIANMAARGPQSMAGIEGFGDVVKSYTGGDIAGAVKGASRIASSISADQAGRLGRSGGAVGKQISALHRTQRLVGALDVEQTKKLKNDLMKLGFDVETMGGPELKRMLGDGVTAEEMEGEGGVQQRISDVVKTHMSETRGSRGTANQQMQDMLGIYTKNNTDFVNAVNHALGGEGQLGKAHAALTGSKSDAASATPWYDPRGWGGS